MAAETGHRHDVPADPIIKAGCGRIDPSRNLIAWHHRDRRQVRIKSHAAENVGKIDAARLDPDAHLAGFGLRVGRLLELEHLRRAGARDPDLPHG